MACAKPAATSTLPKLHTLVLRTLVRALVVRPLAALAAAAVLPRRSAVGRALGLRLGELEEVLLGVGPHLSHSSSSHEPARLGSTQFEAIGSLSTRTKAEVREVTHAAIEWASWLPNRFTPSKKRECSTLDQNLRDGNSQIFTSWARI